MLQLNPIAIKYTKKEIRLIKNVRWLLSMIETKAYQRFYQMPKEQKDHIIAEDLLIETLKDIIASEKSK